MHEKQSISINDIYQAINDLDTQREYKGISYNMTTHNILNPDAWWVFIPYGRWSINPGPPNPSPLESAIVQAIPSGTRNECFIDIMHLAYSPSGFFSDPKASETIADALASFINSLPSSVTPVIRYLVGNSPFTKDQGMKGDGFFNDLVGGNLITNKNAMLYYGNFSPNVQLSSDHRLKTSSFIESAISRIWHWFSGELCAAMPEMCQKLDGIETDIVSWIKEFIDSVLGSPVSWNHAKIFAVNGENLVTGGANYYPDHYGTGQQWLFDLSMSITGEAAVDAHRFADYLWKYLSNIPFTDQTSWTQAYSFESKAITANAQAPLFNFSPTSRGDMSALFVGKNGNWPWPHFGYPAQIFDAIRDLILNIVAVVGDSADVTVSATKLLSDCNPGFKSVLNDIRMNSAVWASRYARNYAVSRARRSVRLAQQKLVMDDLASANKDGYNRLVTEVNKYAKSHWNGYVWPYDLLMALGRALFGISNNPTDTESGIEIVTSCPSTYNGFYQDPIEPADFTNKLVWVMSGMQSSENISPTSNPQDIVKKHLTYKRISNSTSTPNHGNHAKLVIVDDSVCYIGSGNAYPSYNQEFGLWIDDQPSIKSFITDYWAGLWGFARKAISVLD